MASLILLAGTASPITVVCQKLGKSANRYVGSKTDSVNGAERSSVRGQKRVIPVVTGYLTTAEEASIQAAVMNGVQIPCSGDILQNIQTVCSVEVAASDIVPSLVGFFVMQLVIYEVQPTVVLLKYAPGDTITGESFSRSSTGRRVDVNGVYASVVIDGKRDHYINGVRSLLLEGPGTNLCLQAENFGTTWAAVGTPTRTPAALTIGTVVLDLLGDDDGAALEGYTQSITFTADAAKAVSVHVAKDTSASSVIRLRDTTAGADRLLAVVTWAGSAPSVAMTTGTFLWAEPLASGVYRLHFTTTSVTAANTNSLQVYPSTTSALATANTGRIYAGAVQAENALIPTSYIPTTTITVSRSPDAYSLPFTPPPQEMTVYLKIVELGTLSVSGELMAISSGASAPTFEVYGLAGNYSVSHNNGPSAVLSTLATAPSVGSVDEVLARLFGDGSIDATQSIAGGTSTSAAQSAAKALATAWSGQLVWLNTYGAGASRGFTAIQSFKVVAGMRSLAEMRAA